MSRIPKSLTLPRGAQTVSPEKETCTSPPPLSLRPRQTKPRPLSARPPPPPASSSPPPRREISAMAAARPPHFRCRCR
ncbi:unnamed protein product [Rangifer tarandus platyrhynchus]|uniref:Uncharacterized protein n=2 Tax=Rangifer tarandus platyrhynchus TaxID=3082113 RepID=A0ABN8ZT16_RANTA|nr:unnamed protein product [Rangifer tarandus platyrhynchus]CAI9710384.1 unnamed protein product [Rangifer tarandus platyrhynchus]